MLVKPSRELSKIFSSKMFMTRQSYSRILGELFLAEKYSGFWDDMPKYNELTSEIVKRLSENSEINLTTEYDSMEILDNSVAFHRISGLILAEESWWYFSTKQFRADLLAADANPKVIAHFIATNSGGGEAWFLDVAAETMRNLTKPVVAHYEDVAASAAIFLTINADKIFAATPNETIGSIGTMVSFLDIIPLYEKLGAKWYEEYATQSDLKNKKFNDLIDGKPEKYIKEDLDPLAQQFIEAVAAARPKSGALGFEDPVFRGETFNTQGSIENGLIDGQMLMEDAIQVAYNMGVNGRSNAYKINEALKSF